MADQPQVATGNLLGLPPSTPPPPPPGACMSHADEVTEEWASGDDGNSANDTNQANSPTEKHDIIDADVSDDEPSSQASDDDASDASEDAISVLAQAAVEEAMEAAVRHAHSLGVNDANQDGINANFAISHSEQELTSLEANNSPSTGTRSVLGCQPTGNQRYHDDEVTDDSEDEGGWWFRENSPPPSLPRPTSRCSPCLVNQTQPSDHSDDDNDESEPLKEVTRKIETCRN